MFEVRHYLSADGSNPFAEWFAALGDRNAQARIRVRIDRLERGLFGDAKPCGGGVWELRIDWGPGYRLYYGRAGEAVILLLGGDKRRQSADIRRARQYWDDYQKRTKARREGGG